MCTVYVKDCGLNMAFNPILGQKIANIHRKKIKETVLMTIEENTRSSQLNEEPICYTNECHL